MKNFIIAAVAIFTFLLPANAQGHDAWESDGYLLRILTEDPAGVEITGYCGNDSKLTIPDKFRKDGISYPVWSIGRQAFYYKRDLQEVILPEGLRHIGEMAFTGCHNLAVMVLPGTLVSVDPFAFTETGLRTAVVPDGIGTLDFAAFLNSKNLRTLVLGKGMTDICYAALGKLPGLKELYVLSPEIPNIKKGAVPFCDAGCPDAAVYVPGELKPRYPARPENSRNIKSSMTHDFEDGWAYFHDYRTVPDLFTVLYKEDYSVEAGECLQVLYETINYGGVTVYSTEWVCDDTDVASVQDGCITGNGGGITKGRMKVITNKGSFVSPDFVIAVTAPDVVDSPRNAPSGAHGSGMSLIRDDVGKVEIYSLDGMYLGDGTENLAPGIYVEKTGEESRKFVVK